MRRVMICVLALPLALGACADMNSTQQRTLSGGAIGAAGGAVLGAIGGNAGLGAVAGAGAGLGAACCNEGCTTMGAGSLALTVLPSAFSSSGPGLSFFSASACKRLGRPISTPWAIVFESDKSRSGLSFASKPIRATFALPVAGSSAMP